MRSKFIIVIILILLITFSFGGTIAVADEAISSFLDGIESFFERIVDGIYDFFTDEPDWDTMTLEELTIAVEDEEVFTDDRLDDMMIDRETLLYLLHKVENYNDRNVTKSAVVEVYYDWEYTDFYSFCPPEKLEQIKELYASGNTQEAEALESEIVQQMSGSGTAMKTFTFSDIVSHDFPVEWQFLYLFSTYVAIASSLHDDEWRITTEQIDMAFDYVAPKIIYDDTPLSPDNPVTPYIYMSDLGDYEITTDYDITTQVNNFKQHFYGRLPFITAAKVETLLYTCYIDYDYNDITCQYEYRALEKSNYLDALNAAGESLCRGYHLDIFLEQLRELPGGNELADKIELYDERGESD